MQLTHVRRGVYDGAHKLAIVGDKVEGLFDVSQDPTEIHDVSRQHTALVTELKARIGHFVQGAVNHRAERAAQAGEVSEEVVDQLRALGYIE
jgi:hypothetical protein